MSRINTTCVVAFALICVMVPMAEAGVILENDFNTVTNGFLLQNGATHDTVNGVVNILDTSTTTNPDMVTDHWDPDVVTDPVVISFDYKLNTIGGANHSLTVNGGGVQGILMNMMSAQKISYRTSAAFVDLLDGTAGNKIIFNRWYNFEMTLSPETDILKTWDLDVTDIANPGATTAWSWTDLEFRNLPPEYNTVQWFMNVPVTVANNASYDIDNVSISTVPEPATLTMLGLAGLALALVRRRIRSA